MAPTQLLTAILSAVTLSVLVCITRGADTSKFGFVEDDWGTVNLPFASGYCQHGFPVRHFTEYECFNNSYYTTKVGPLIAHRF